MPLHTPLNILVLSACFQVIKFTLKIFTLCVTNLLLVSRLDYLHYARNYFPSASCSWFLFKVSLLILYTFYLLVYTLEVPPLKSYGSTILNLKNMYLWTLCSGHFYVFCVQEPCKTLLPRHKSRYCEENYKT